MKKTISMYQKWIALLKNASFKWRSKTNPRYMRSAVIWMHGALRSCMDEIPADSLLARLQALGLGASIAETIQESAINAKVGSLTETILEVPQMDCAAEERLVRMALGRASSVLRLDFDLPASRVTVLHQGDPEALLDLLSPLNLGAHIADSHPTTAVAGLPPSASRSEAASLKILLAINAFMFVAESAAGWLAESTGLIADSLDMFADAAVYGVSLFAVGRSANLQARAARLSGYLQLLLALGAVSEVIRRFAVGSDPEPPYMIGVAFVALLANVTCMALIAKHREGAVHMRASWIFSTNDVIANLGVILAGALVAWTRSPLPDLVVGILIAGVVVAGAPRILKLARLQPIERR